jgi:CheY-like chemotaxis protein
VERATLRQGPLDGLRLVVVDDDRVSLMAISAIVRAWGASTRAATCAREALRLIKEDRPDLVVSDLYMPEMDGFDLMRRVRELPPGNGGHTPGIAVTAHPSFDSRRDAERAGYGAVFSKPFPREELKDAILALTRATGRPD